MRTCRTTERSLGQGVLGKASEVVRSLSGAISDCSESGFFQDTERKRRRRRCYTVCQNTQCRCSLALAVCTAAVLAGCTAPTFCVFICYASTGCRTVEFLGFVLLGYLNSLNSRYAISRNFSIDFTPAVKTLSGSVTSRRFFLFFFRRTSRLRTKSVF